MTAKGDKVLPKQTVHETYVTWDKAFGGHATELRIIQYEGWSEVVLLGGGRRDEHGDAFLINYVPVDVLRRIVAMHDALPSNKVGT